MWGEAIRVAAYLLNRSPTEDGLTPYERWMGRKPNLSNLQIFGSEAHSRILGNLKKLENRSEKYIFVGYGLNGYRLWDETKRKIILRDVVFGKVNKRREADKNRFLERKIDIFEDSQERRLRRDTEESFETPEGSLIEDVEEETDEDLNGGEEIQERQSNRTTRSGRNVKLPAKFGDYVMLTYQDAISSENKEKWKEAIDEEHESIRRNNTWKLVERDTVGNAKILTNRWVFKRKDDGTYKARLVVRGCEQRYGVDYEETYSPVLSASSMRILFALAAGKGYKIAKFDVKTAFLYGELKEETFMYPPEGYEAGTKVCRLQKALYGLKQAPLCWNNKLISFLRRKGMQATILEPTIWRSKRDELIVAFYVDDGLVLGKNEERMRNFLEEFREEFEIKSVFSPSSFLGIEVVDTQVGIKLKQTGYVAEIVRKYQMDEAKTAVTPITELKHREIKVTEKDVKFPYREAIGSLMYLCNKTRPDISFAVGYSSRFVEKPKSINVVDVKRIL